MVRLLGKDQVEMAVSKNVVDKIRAEEKKHIFKEFGGYLLVTNKGHVEDIVFDMDEQSLGSVNLGCEEIMKLSSKQRKMVKGWFHKHPISGLSGTDRNTVAQLTAFWGVCYTMILQSNGTILLLKTIHDPEKQKRIEEKEKKEQEKLEKEKQEKEQQEQTETDEVVHIEPRYSWLIRRGKKRIKKKEKIPEWRVRWITQDDWKATSEIFRKEIPFGITQFTPQFTNEIKKYRLYYPKYKGLSRELNIIDMMEADKIVFSTPRATFNILRQDMIKLLKKGNIKPLSCTGIIDINKRILYENDKVKYTSAWSPGGEGKIILSDGSWVVESKSFLYKEKNKLDDGIAVEFISDVAGVENVEIQ